MTPTYWESKASRLHPYRWRLGGTTLLAFLVLGASMALGEHLLMVMSVAIGLPVIVVAWGFLCASVWFEPTKGRLRTDSWLGRHIPPLNTIARWWAAFFLLLWFIVGFLVIALWVIGVIRTA